MGEKDDIMLLIMMTMLAIMTSGDNENDGVFVSGKSIILIAMDDNG